MPQEAQRRSTQSTYLNLAARWHCWSTPRFGRFMHWSEIRQPQQRETSGSPRASLADNSPTGDRSPKPPVRSESLYRPNCLFGQPDAVVQYVRQFDKEYFGHIFGNSPEIFVVIRRISHIMKQIVPVKLLFKLQTLLYVNILHTVRTECFCKY